MNDPDAVAAAKAAKEAKKTAKKAAAKQRRAAYIKEDKKKADRRRRQVHDRALDGADGARVPPKSGIADGPLGDKSPYLVTIPQRMAGVEPTRKPIRLPTARTSGTKYGRGSGQKVTAAQKSARDLAVARRLGISVDELKVRRRDTARQNQELAAQAKARGITVKELKRLRQGGR